MLDFLARLDRWEKKLDRALSPPKPKRAKKLRPTDADVARAHAARERARQEAAESGKEAPLFPEYFDEPVRFAVEVLGLRLCRAQRRILDAIARGRRVVIRSGQKTGKSTSFVAAALWWAATRPRGRVLLTAPGYRQVKKVLWKELRRIVYDKENLRADKRRVVEVLCVEPAFDPETGMQWPDGREIVGFAANSPGATQGFSGPEMLIVIDEGSEVDDDIFEAHEGNTSGGGRILAASNPIHNTGWFYEAFHAHREFWETIHLSSEDTPNVTGEEPPVPGLAERDFIEMVKRKYGEESAYYQIRIKGEFAGTATNTVVGLKLVETACKRWKANLAVVRSEPLEIGVDVARFGDDDTTIAPRRGPRIYPLTETQGADGNVVAGLILKVVRELRFPNERPVVKIDGTGGYGASPIDILRTHHSDEVEVVEVNASSKADDEEKYANLRAQLHFGVAEFLSSGGELPANDRKLEADLLAPTYTFDPRRRFLVESKKDIKKRLKRSPDRADAVGLAVYKAPVETIELDPAYDDYLPAMRV